MLEELNSQTEQHCLCGFPLQPKDDICVACLPAHFRMSIGRQTYWYQVEELDKEEQT
ncbi:MAG: hypothetical protein ACFFD8_01735 [Candidatus Thorarchaeota archaeon]